jgi:uncharacterized membrane protein (DUF2068 family)
MTVAAARGDRMVAAIGAFKIVKCALLLGLGVVWLAGAADGGMLMHAAAWTGALEGHRVLRAAVARLASLDARALRELAIATFAYAGLFAVEGVGLLLRKRWAEWLTVFVTGSFIPLEIYELALRPRPAKVVALALNVSITVYLLWRRLTARAGRRAERRARGSSRFHAA